MSETINIGEVKHQCNCLQNQSIRGQYFVRSVLCIFDIYTFITREVDYPEYAYKYKD